MTINESSYDTNITVDLTKFNLSLKTQYIKTDDDLQLKILSFIEKFDLIKVTIPDQRLQEIWNLFMNTEMMQDFLIEDIFHHYFIKSLPQVDLTNLVTIPVNGKNFALKVLEIPQVVKNDNKTFLDTNLGLEMVSSPKGIYIEDINKVLKVHSEEYKMLKSKIQTDTGEDDKTQDIQIIADASLLSIIGSDMLSAFEINLSEIEAVKSFLTLKNLRIVFPSLANFYSEDSDIVNMNLSLNIKGKGKGLIIWKIKKVNNQCF
jgi:hypothetical protein